MMKILNRFLETVLAILVALMVVGCFWQVITRFLLHNPSKYTEELLRYMLIWLTMLGVPYAYGKESHLSINLITRTFKPKNLTRTKIGIEFLVLFISVFELILYMFFSLAAYISARTTLSASSKASEKSSSSAMVLVYV